MRSVDALFLDRLRVIVQFMEDLLLAWHAPDVAGVETLEEDLLNNGGAAKQAVGLFVSGQGGGEELH
jgi:hypothetical protein